MAVLHPAVSRLFSNRIPASPGARSRAIILPATSTPVVVSTPSSPGEAFTSITSGPRARKISTPAASSPRVCVALMAMALLVANLRHRGHAAAVQVRAKSLFRPPLDRRHHLIADHRAADIAPFRFGNVFLHQNMSVQSAKASITLSAAAGLRQHHADPGCPPPASPPAARPTMAIRSLVSSGSERCRSMADRCPGAPAAAASAAIASAGDGDRLIQRIASGSSNWRRAAVP